MRPRFVVVLCAAVLLALCPPPRGWCAQTSSTVSAESLDPNNPSLTPQERLDRQRALINKRIADRQKLIHEKKQEMERQLNATRLAVDSKLSSATQELMAKMPGLMAELNREFEKVRRQMDELMAKAGPALKQAVAQPEPRSYKVDVEAVVAGNQKLELTGFGDDEIIFSAPLITDDQANKMRLVGSFEFTINLKPLETPGKVQADYKLTLNVPMVQKYNYGNNNQSSGQITFSSGTKGKVVLKTGEPKQVVRLGENTIKMTVTPE